MWGFLLGALTAAGFMSSVKVVSTTVVVDEHQKKQIDEVLTIADTINFLGRTLPPDTDITASVIELKARFDQIDGEAITDPVGRKNYNAVKAFFDANLG